MSGIDRQLAPQQAVQHGVVDGAVEVIALACVAFLPEAEALQAADRGVVARVDVRFETVQQYARATA